jgi:hypothetical protein
MRMNRPIIAVGLSFLFLLMVAPVASIHAQSLGAAPVCAREVPSGSVVNPSAGTITLSNGSIVAAADIPCSMTSVIWGATGNAAYGTLTISSSEYYTDFSNQWTTPSAPSSGSFSSPEGIGIWNGLGSSSSGDVVQPLLVYGCITSSDCSDSWRLTAYAYIGGTVYYVTPLSPSQGNTIQGTATLGDWLSCSGGSGSGQGYGIGAKIVSGSSVSLNVCTHDLYTLAAAGSIEVHDLSTCTQMPNTGSDTFGTFYFTTSGTNSATEGTGSDVSFCSASASWNNNNPSNILLDLSWSTS